jgi:hypothetical protein
VDLGLERILLRKHLPLAVAAIAALLVVFAPTLAAAATPATGVTDTISIQEVKGLPEFVAPASVQQGDQLEIVNETSAKKFGPHTFSLVTKSSVPKTKPARHLCFTPKHICLAIAGWHGVKGEHDPVTVNPVEAGAEGWDTLGSVTKKGDSWFTGVKPGAKFSQQVSADPATTPTLYFVCAIHPWMHGRVNVLPAGS